MKNYVFVNRYCKGIQAGIQAAHAVAELSKIDTDDYYDWATNHRTLILLDGGDHNQLEEIGTKLTNYSVDFGLFREEGLNDSITAISFVANEDVMEAMHRIKKWRKERTMSKQNFETHMFDKYEIDFEIAKWLLTFNTHGG